MGLFNKGQEAANAINSVIKKYGIVTALYPSCVNKGVAIFSTTDFVHKNCELVVSWGRQSELSFQYGINARGFDRFKTLPQVNEIRNAYNRNARHTAMEILGPDRPTTEGYYFAMITAEVKCKESDVRFYLDQIMREVFAERHSHITDLLKIITI